MSHNLLEEKVKAVLDRDGKKLIEIFNVKTAKLVKSQASTAVKYERLVSLTDRAAAIVAPCTPCRKGCSSCCYMATGISEFEASLITQATGREFEEVAIFHPPEFYVAKYSGVPCTFLAADGTCSIYEVRPLACRAHHVIEENADKCKIVEGKKEKAASISFHTIDLAAASILHTYQFGDIREFFPKGE